jgi:ATP synthase protein I
MKCISGEIVTKHDDHKFITSINTKVTRKLKLQRQPGRSIWLGLGIMGIIGWSVSVPTLLGLTIGFYIDQYYPSAISWTLNLLLIGLAIGCLSAWIWIANEDKDIHSKKDENDD